MKFKHYFQTSLLKSLIFNFRILPFKDAVKLPVLLFRNTHIGSVKGRIEIAAPIKHGMIKIGRCNICGMEKSPTTLSVDGVLRFNGKATIGSGSVIWVNKTGELIIGKNFRITGRTSIYCRKKITFGDNNLISWDNLFMDSDQHDILDENGNILNPDKEINIGSSVWFGCRCTVLKGCSIADNSVIASGSILTHSFSEPNSIIGGSGSGQKVLRSGIFWNA